MKKHYIILANALALAGTSLIAMEPSSATKQVPTMVTLNKDQYKRLDRLFDKFTASIDKKNEFSDSEKDFFVRSYQTIHTNLSNVDTLPNSDNLEECINKLQEYKKKIYTLAVELMINKKAAKQWLKQADFYSDEEENDGTRTDYYVAKRALAIQENRKNELVGLEDTINRLKKDNESGRKAIAELQEKLSRAQAALEVNEKDQAKIAADLQATERTINLTQVTANNKLEKLQKDLESIVQQTARAKLELAKIELSKETVACDKTARTALIKTKNDEIAKLVMAQVQTQRDIDLLKKDYGTFKKGLWKMTALFNLYPVSIKTPEPDLSEISQSSAPATSEEIDAAADASLSESLEDKEKVE